MKNKKTVLFFTRRFYPQIGGVETHVMKVSRELVERGYKVTVIAEALGDEYQRLTDKVNTKWQNGYMDDKVTGEGDWIVISINSRSLNEGSGVLNTQLEKFKNTQSDTNNIILYRLPKVKDGRLKKIFIWLWLWKNRGIIKSSDIIHCHDVFYWYLPFKFLYPRKKVYTTFHGYEKFPVPLKHIIVRKISEILSDGCICVGDFISKWYGTKADFVMYGGVDKIKNEKIKVNKEKSHIRIVFIGRVEEDNGVLIYCKALERLSEMGISYKFEVLGDGSLSKDFQKHGSVYGFVEKPEEYIAAADIVFASSYLSILQALKYGKPVVAVYVNPLKEDYLKMSPFSKWINIVNTEITMLKFIEQYIVDKDSYNKFIQEGLRWARSQSWAKVADMYQMLWDRSRI